MAVGFGSVATGVGSLADAFETNRRQALEERRQQVIDAQTAQREKYQNLYQQALLQKEKDERQYGHYLRTEKLPDGSSREWWWDPTKGVHPIVTEGSAGERAKAYAANYKLQTGKDLPDELYQQVLWRFSGGTGAVGGGGLKQLSGDAGKPYQGKDGAWYVDMKDAAGDIVSVPMGANYKPPVKQDAFREYMSDPENYKKFLTVTSQVKAMFRNQQKPSIGGMIAAARLLGMAYHYNPDMLSAVGPMVADTLRKSGVNLPPDADKIFSETPLGQPVSPVTGAPIGTSMPSAPTTSTRNAAQVAQRTLAEMPRIRQQVTAAAQQLGPVQGRLMIGFLLGTVGSTGDPAMDEQLSQLRADLTLTGSATSKFHINSVRQAEMFDRMIGTGKSSAEAIQGFLNAVEEWARKSSTQGLGYGETGATAPGGPPAVIPADVMKQVLQGLK